MKRLAVAGVGVMLFSAAPGAAQVAPPQGAPARAPAAPAPAPAVQPAAITRGPVVAQAGNVNVTMDQLQRPLVEAYGLNVLLNLVQLEVAKENAARAGVKVTPQDVEQERELTIERMFRESNEKLTDQLNAARDKGNAGEADQIAEQIRSENLQAFEQFLVNQRITRAEFDIVTETNAYLRKIAEPMLAGKIGEENLKEAFNTLYGATVKCRHIQCANVLEINQAKQRLEAGEPFAKVAMEMSRNPGTAPLGGELPPFNLQTQGLPQAFKEAAWALQKEGDVSDIVQAEGGFHLIVLEKRIEPKAVKFEDVKESLRARLYDEATQAVIKELRGQLADQAVQGLVINDPVLKQQWQEKLQKREAAIRDRDEMRKQMQLERERTSAQPAPDLAPSSLAP